MKNFRNSFTVSIADLFKRIGLSSFAYIKVSTHLLAWLNITQKHRGSAVW